VWSAAPDRHAVVGAGRVTAAILAFVNAWDEPCARDEMTASICARCRSASRLQGRVAFPWPLISAALIHRDRAIAS